MSSNSPKGSHCLLTRCPHWWGTPSRSLHFTIFSYALRSFNLNSCRNRQNRSSCSWARRSIQVKTLWSFSYSCHLHQSRALPQSHSRIMIGYSRISWWRTASSYGHHLMSDDDCLAFQTRCGPSSQKTEMIFCILPLLLHFFLPRPFQEETQWCFLSYRTFSANDCAMSSSFLNRENHCSPSLRNLYNQLRTEKNSLPWRYRSKFWRGDSLGDFITCEAWLCAPLSDLCWLGKKGRPLPTLSAPWLPCL